MQNLTEHSNLLIGRMDGRLTALESRIDRHEVFTTGKLNAIETKLDDVLMAQAAGTGNMKAIRWIIGIVISIGAWVHGHLSQSPGTH
jgi:hypothetical protein